MEFVRKINGKVVNRARVERVLFGAHAGCYDVLTSTKGKSYEQNTNIPFFVSAEEAEEYMLSLPGWETISKEETP